MYRADLHRVVGRWRRPASGPELRRGYRAVLAAAEAAACPFWVLDVRGQAPPDDGTRQWLRETFLPGLAGHFERPVCLGILVSPHRPDQLRRPAGLDAVAQLAFFEDEGALNNWLAGHQMGAAAAT